MTYKVVLPLDRPGFPQNPQGYNDVGAELIQKPCQTDQEIMDVTSDADAVLVSLIPISEKVIENMKKCRIISCASTGYNNVDVEAATKHGILVTSVPDYCTEDVSTHTMALILACARKLVQQSNMVKNGEWKTVGRVEFRQNVWPSMKRLKVQTLGLVALGKIAQLVVPKAKSFGLRVIAYDPYVNTDVAKEMGVELVEFDQLLEESDFISLHSPLTDETKHLIGIEELKKMKSTAYLINASRGGLVNEEMLYTALVNKYIAGAGLDVMESEPPDPDSPLFKLENVVVTPHCAFFSEESVDELNSRAEEDVLRVLRGEWPLNLVNHQAKEKFSEKWKT